MPKKPEPTPVMKFKIVSTGCEIELVRLQKTINGKSISRPIYTFRYLNRPGKPDFTTYKENVNQAINMQTWKPI